MNLSILCKNFSNNLCLIVERFTFIVSQHFLDVLFMKKIIISALLVSLIATPVLAHEPTNHTLTAPQLSHGTNFNEYYHRQIALWSLQQINASMSLIDDPWSVQVIYGMTAQMNAVVRTEPIIAVPLINDNNINAFAVPGGLIGLNTGTVLSSNGLDEVASVLAHEIAHLSQRHYEHRTENNKKLLALQLGGLLAALAASAAGGDAALAVMASSQTATAENAAAHSRDHEREADRVGQQILAKAGYDAHAMPRFFHQLYKQVSLHQSKNAFAPSFMQSHPFTMERLSESTARASTYPAVAMSDKELQARTFDLLSWRLKYLTKQVGFAELNAHVKQSDGARLAMVAHLTEQGQYQRAHKTWQEGQFHQDDVLATIVQAELLMAQHQYQAAADMLSSVQAIYPERRDLRLHLAQNLIHVGKIAEALSLIQNLVVQHPYDVQAWQLIQRAYEHKAQTDQAGRSQDISTIYALQARSQVELWTAKYDNALQSNAQALKVAQSHPTMTAVISLLEKDKQSILAAQDFKIK